MVNIWSKIDTKRAHITCLLHVFLNDQCRIFIEVSCYIVTLPPRQNVPSEEFHSDDDPNSINNGANGESLPILVGELRINENTSMPSFSSTDVNNTETLTLTTRNRFMDNSQPTSSVYSHAAGENDEDGTTTPTEERALPNERRENTPRHEETEHPRHTLYADQSVRISYFLNWPSTITQAPNELADAGFFYSGNGDHTRCFFCGGGLRNWEPGDDPWIEHARWFRHCRFVTQNKGQQFVDLVQRSVREQEQQRAERITEEHRESDVKDALQQTLYEHKKKQSSKSSTKNTQKEKSSILTTDKPTESEEDSSLKESLLCKICFCKTVCIVFLPCGHICCCDECVKLLENTSVHYVERLSRNWLKHSLLTGNFKYSPAVKWLKY